MPASRITRLGDGGTDRGFVPNDAAGKGRDQADTGRGNPWIEIGDELLAQHGLEPIDEGAGFDERWHVRLDGGNRDGICFAQMIARRNVSTILRQPSVEFKLGCLAFSAVD
jgi:hypothetical protein